MLKTIFIDMDNTLLETQVLYEDAHVRLARLIQGAGPFEEADILKTVRKEEADLFKVYAYRKEMLPHAFANTLLIYVPDATPAEIRLACDFAYEVYDREAAQKPGAMEAVQILSKDHKVCLITAGDEDVQRKRIDKMPCKEAFHKIFIVDEKNAGTYRNALAETGTVPGEAIMIGDSLKSDILPAIEAGLETIFISAANWSAREMQGVNMPEKGMTMLNSIRKAAAEICSRRQAPGPKPAPGLPKLK